jgi:hypothetical protein
LICFLIPVIYIKKQSRKFPVGDEPNHYELVLRHAAEDIAVIATRYGINSRHLLVAFDLGREPGRHEEHTVTITIRDTDIAVTAEGIPHYWLGAGTGFIDTRLSRRIGPALIQLDNKAQAAGYRLD